MSRRFLVRKIFVLFALITGFGIRSAVAEPTTSTNELKILIVMGENVYYEKEIAEGFVGRLRRKLAEKSIQLVERERVIPDFSKSAYASPDSSEGADVWRLVTDAINKKYNPGDIDYIITLGSFASRAIKNSNLVQTKHAKGQVYLGVTNPTSADLVGQTGIAGVQYGSGGVDYGRKILELFPPNQKLVFIYQAEKGKGNIQDESIAADFIKLNKEYESRYPNARKPRLEIRPIGGLIEVQDLQQGNPADPENSEIYIGWYGLDNILAHTNGERLRQANIWIVPSSNTPQNLDLAGVIVTVDDRFVGELGADIILKHMANPQLDLKQEKVRKPRFKVLIKKEVLKAKGVKLLDAAFTRQEDVTYTYR